MKKVYIAGKWANKKEMKNKINIVKKMGFIITHDWTTNETLTRSHKELGHYAKLDIDGVTNADILIAVMDDPLYAYRGSFTEIGCALGQNKRVIIYCPYKKSLCKTNCFYHHPLVTEVDEWNKVLDYMTIYK